VGRALPRPRARAAAAWLALAGATVAAGKALDGAGIPSSYLFAGLLLGLATALAAPRPPVLPHGAFVAAQAVTGVALGAYVQASSFAALGDAWLPVAMVSAGTLAVSIGAGMLLGRFTAVDAPTAALGMIAGGASGIVTMARELGGDDRLVAFMQYARVLVVVLITPLLIPLAFPGHHGGPAPGAAAVPLLGEPGSWLWTAGIATAGAVAGRLARLPAGMLLGPMILTAVLELAGPADDLAVPPVVQDAAFIAIGLQVGLGFTVQTVREVGRLLIPVVLCILGLIAACAGLAVLLDATSDVTFLDAYLATTPGGLYAVVAVALGADANSTFIIAVQALRVVVMVLLAPLVVRRMLGAPAART
jgi:membrane AbrB-like protein